jgi:hypothetical protein
LINERNRYSRITQHKWYVVSIKKKRLQVIANHRRPDGKRGIIRLARLIANCPAGLLVDHINGDTTDNRRANLRICTKAQNNMNRHSEAKWKGVRYYERLGKWQAYIAVTVDGRKRFKSLGYYLYPVEAAAAYNRAANQYFGEFACLNDLSRSFH